MRVYIPITVDQLANHALNPGNNTWQLPPGIVHGVTSLLRVQYPEADDEELEWEAFNNATDDSLALIRQDASATPLRAVLSVDIPSSSINQSGNSMLPAGATASSLAISEVPNAEIAAIHVDERDLAQTIAPLQAGHPATKTQNQKLDDAHLLWYHPSEIPQLLSDSNIH